MPRQSFWQYLQNTEGNINVKLKMVEDAITNNNNKNKNSWKNFDVLKLLNNLSVVSVLLHNEFLFEKMTKNVTLYAIFLILCQCVLSFTQNKYKFRYTMKIDTSLLRRDFWKLYTLLPYWTKNKSHILFCIKGSAHWRVRNIHPV